MRSTAVIAVICAEWRDMHRGLFSSFLPFVHPTTLAAKVCVCQILSLENMCTSFETHLYLFADSPWLAVAAAEASSSSRASAERVY